MLQQGLDPQVEAQVYYLKAKSLFYLEDLDGSLFLLRRAIKTDAEEAVYRGFEGQVLFELGQFEAALRALEQSMRLEPDSPHTMYHMALSWEHRGAYEQADRLFQAAAAADPETYLEPVRLPLADFEAIVREALDDLPELIREFISSCPVLIEDLPDARLVEEAELSPQILGLFVGVPATEPGASPTLGTLQRSESDRILLYKRNLEKVAGSRPELARQIRITVQHEVGHYLGLDEEEVERLGLS
jgi:predicted Zn-dependent protease with MMP-like domain